MISAIIPCRNRAPLLYRAIESCLVVGVNEIIVIDDGSDSELCSSQPLVKIIRNETSQGAQNCRIAGLQVATNEYCIFLDSDDELHPTFLDNACAFIKSFPMVYGNTLRNNSVIRRYDSSGDYRKYLFKNLSLAPFSGLLVNRIHIDYDLLSKEIRAWQDDDFIIVLTRKHAPKYIDIVSNISHVSEDSISRSKSNQIEGLKTLLKKYKREIIHSNGHTHYYIFWKIRLLILEIENKNRPTQNLMAKALRLAVSPFFNHISS
jgi:glycosyltransferase involved in cell wall biosynthesis